MLESGPLGQSTAPLTAATGKSSRPYDTSPSFWNRVSGTCITSVCQELGGFYLDSHQGPLSTPRGAKDSTARVPVQTAMYHIAEALDALGNAPIPVRLP